MKRLLAIFAHPDDEATWASATLARYAAAGVRVALVSATAGEAGCIGARTETFRLFGGPRSADPMEDPFGLRRQSAAVGTYLDDGALAPLEAQLRCCFPTIG